MTADVMIHSITKYRTFASEFGSPVHTDRIRWSPHQMLFGILWKPFWNDLTVPFSISLVYGSYELLSLRLSLIPKSTLAL